MNQAWIKMAMDYVEQTWYAFIRIRQWLGQTISCKFDPNINTNDNVEIVGFHLISELRPNNMKHLNSNFSFTQTFPM